MKNTSKIILSNWVTVIGFIITVYLFTFLMMFVISPEQDNERMGIWLGGTLILIFGYGITVWLGFLIAIILLDIILIVPSRKRLTEKLILEWLIIIPPFIYWAFKYDYWLWLMLVSSFLFTQMIRKSTIVSLIKT